MCQNPLFDDMTIKSGWKKQAEKETVCVNDYKEVTIMNFAQILGPDSVTNRLTVQGDGLCCGYPLEVLIPRLGGPVWVQTTLELGPSGWYLVGLPDVQPSGLWVRW